MGVEEEEVWRRHHRLNRQRTRGQEALVALPVELIEIVADQLIVHGVWKCHCGACLDVKLKKFFVDCIASKTILMRELAGRCLRLKCRRRIETAEDEAEEEGYGDKFPEAQETCAAAVRAACCALVRSNMMRLATGAHL